MSDEPLLLTPGPLTTARATKEAMLHDWGSRDRAFIALTRRVSERLAALAGAAASHACVPVQGSGTFAVEAMLGTLIPPSGKVLVLVNGAYGARMVEICRRIGRRAEALTWPETEPVAAGAVDRRLAEDRERDLGHVALVHCETTTGLVNPAAEIARVVARHGRRLLLDAMSAFGALDIDPRAMPFEALAASANKCLEGVPGVAFVLALPSSLAAARGSAHSLSLDLSAQWTGLQETGQWRFTPPTQVMAALDAALDLLDAEGGIAARRARYEANRKTLVGGMRDLGFETLLPDALQSPVIVTFRSPRDSRFRFGAFYDGLRERGFAIYPGKLTQTPTFRIGCVGQVRPDDMRRLVGAVAETLAALGVRRAAP